MSQERESVLVRLQTKWGIQSKIDFFAILVVFAINGSFAAWVADPITSYIGLDKATTNGFIYWPIRILIIFPLYQLTLPLVGWCFGQFKFFWAFEKKMFGRFTGKNRRARDAKN